MDCVYTIKSWILKFVKVLRFFFLRRLVLIGLRVLFFYYFLLFVFNTGSVFLDWVLYDSRGFFFSLRFIIDYIRLLFVRVVLFISRMVVLYRVYYMENDKYKLSYLMVLLLFVVSMCLVIISPNLVRLLLGWDGLGFTSYILVIFYQRVKREGSGLITILRNRVGDTFLILRVALLRFSGRWNYTLLDLNRVLLRFMVMVAGITKRAQYPFCAWLPEAIAAPTPISALVHSSTLVTAGVYLLIRFNWVITANYWGLFLVIVSLVTIFIARFIAFVEVDLKKVVALRTLRQLGFIILRLRIGFVKIAFFHLIIHAFFKSCLFICIGYVIHRTEGNQDFRMVELEGKERPLLIRVVRVLRLRLCGLPFFNRFLF